MAKPMPAERPYESLFICPVEAPQKTVDAFIEKIKATLTQANATVRSIQIWGRRRLTYPIKHNRDGLYVYVDFNGGAQSAEALKNLFRVSDIVLRHLTTERVELRPPYVRRTPEQIAAGTEAGAVAASAPAAAAPAAATQTTQLPSGEKEA